MQDHPQPRSSPHRVRPSAHGWRLALIALFGIIIATCAHAQDSTPTVPSPAQRIGQLAKTDIHAAVELLRQSDIDPYSLYQVFTGLDTSTRLHLLNAIIRDHPLANGYNFDPLVLSPSAPRKPPAPIEDKKKDPQSVRDTIVQQRGQSMRDLIDAAPEDLPAILLLPSVTEQLYLFTVLDVVLRNTDLFDGEISPVPPQRRAPGTPADSPLLLPILDDPDRKKIPEHYHEVLKLGAELAWLNLQQSEPIPQIQVDFKRIAELIDEADLPVSVRLGFASLGNSHSEKFPDHLRIKIGHWLADAWENNLPAGTYHAADVLETFLVAHRHGQWQATARRLIDAVPEPGEKEPSDDEYPIRDALSWMVGVAAQADDRPATENFIAQFANSKAYDPLASDPAFALLVRAGYHDLALKQLTARKNELLNNDTSLQQKLFDDRLEDRLPDFLATIPHPELRYIAELHLKIIPDSPHHAPKSDRPTRISELAQRIEAAPLNSENSKLTALRLIAKEPTAAAEIADVYLRFAQFDRVARHLNNFMRRDQWSELARDTFVAVLAAEHFEGALDIIEKVAAATARLPKNSNDREAHQKTWRLFTATLEDQFEAKSKSDEKSKPHPDLLPIARRFTSLPADHFPLLFNYSRASLITATIKAHADLDATAAWWSWHTSLPDDLRSAHDFCLVRHLLGNDFVEIDHGTNQLPPPQPDTVTHLALTHIFQKIPHDRPIEERLQALLPAITAETPRAIKLIHEFHYLTTEEILTHAEPLTAAFPPDTTQHWFDLTHIALSADRPALATQFQAKANAPPPP